MRTKEDIKALILNQSNGPVDEREAIRRAIRLTMFPFRGTGRTEQAEVIGEALFDALNVNGAFKNFSQKKP